MIESNSKTIQHSCFPSPSILDLTSPRYHQKWQIEVPSSVPMVINVHRTRPKMVHVTRQSWVMYFGHKNAERTFVNNWDIPSCIPVNYPHSIRPRRRRHSSNSCIGYRTHYRYQSKCRGRQSRLNSLPVISDVKRDRKRIAECKFEMMSCPFRQICQPCSERRYVWMCHVDLRDDHHYWVNTNVAKVTVGHSPTE